MHTLPGPSIPTQVHPFTPYDPPPYYHDPLLAHYNVLAPDPYATHPNIWTENLRYWPEQPDYTPLTHYPPDQYPTHPDVSNHLLALGHGPRIARRIASHVYRIDPDVWTRRACLSVL